MLRPRSTAIERSSAAAVEVNEVVFKEFDAVEARRCNCLELLPQGAAHRDRRHGSAHRDFSVADLRNRAQLVGGRAAEAEEFEIGRDHLEQHVGADLNLEAT